MRRPGKKRANWTRSAGGVGRHLDLVAYPNEHVFQKRAELLVIIDHENAGHR